MPMTPEEFKRSVQEIYSDLKDPGSEYSQLKDEFKAMYDDIAPHDHEMAEICMSMFNSFVALGEHVRRRIET